MFAAAVFAARTTVPTVPQTCHLTSSKRTATCPGRGSSVMTVPARPSQLPRFGLSSVVSVVSSGVGAT